MITLENDSVTTPIKATQANSLQMQISDVNNKFLTNERSKQVARHRINTFVAIFIVSTRKCYWSICKESAWVALVGVVALTCLRWT